MKNFEENSGLANKIIRTYFMLLDRREKEAEDFMLFFRKNYKNNEKVYNMILSKSS